MQMLHDNPAELRSASASGRMPVSDELVAQVVSMGFDADTVRAALHHFNSNVEQVVNELVQGAGYIPDNWYQAVTSSTEQPLSLNNSTSAAHFSSSSDSGECKNHASQWWIQRGERDTSSHRHTAHFLPMTILPPVTSTIWQIVISKNSFFN